MIGGSEYQPPIPLCLDLKKVFQLEHFFGGLQICEPVPANGRGKYRTISPILVPPREKIDLHHTRISFFYKIAKLAAVAVASVIRNIHVGVAR
jgi:hypothetical protein